VIYLLWHNLLAFWRSFVVVVLCFRACVCVRARAFVLFLSHFFLVYLVYFINLYLSYGASFGMTRSAHILTADRLPIKYITYGKWRCSTIHWLFKYINGIQHIYLYLYDCRLDKGFTLYVQFDTRGISENQHSIELYKSNICVRIVFRLHCPINIWNSWVKIAIIEYYKCTYWWPNFI
jgi:hypothetical protein